MFMIYVNSLYFLFFTTACTSSTESGYDSETSRSSSTTPVSVVAEESSDISDEESKVGRRLRTAFTTEQITTLENTFQKHRYLGASERRKLAAKLNLSEVQVCTFIMLFSLCLIGYCHLRNLWHIHSYTVSITPIYFYGRYGDSGVQRAQLFP